jgi:hypothetical protein
MAVSRSSSSCSGRTLAGVTEFTLTAHAHRSTLSYLISTDIHPFRTLQFIPAKLLSYMTGIESKGFHVNHATPFFGIITIPYLKV